MKLDVEGLATGYGGTPILRDVDLSVDDGEIVGVVGTNGVGKTTLLKSVMGLLDLTAGRVTIGDTVVAEGVGPADGPGFVDRFTAGDPAGAVASQASRAVELVRSGSEDATLDPEERAALGVGYVPQGRDVFPGLTVEQNLKLGEGVGATDATAYERVYEYFPILEQRSGQDAGTLSGGQQQMLAIGRALVGVPDLLLVDEPSEGIQPSIVQSITEDLARINAELDTTILFVEQNLSVVQGLADRCYAMDKGRIVDELEGDAIQDRERLADHLAV